MTRVHLKDIENGRLVEFPNSARTFIKVMDQKGHIGVVDMLGGELILFEDLAYHGFEDLVEDVTDCWGFIDPEDPICEEVEPIDSF